MGFDCKLILFLFLIIYVAAQFVLAVGNFGLFGSERDPLSGVFLLPLGLPWNLFIDYFPICDQRSVIRVQLRTVWPFSLTSVANG